MRLEEFAATRSARLNDFAGEIRGIVEDALDNYGSGEWYAPIVEGAGVLWSEIFEQHSPTGDPASARETFLRELGDSLAKTSEPASPPTDGQIDRVVNWVGVYAVNSATYFAGRDSEDAVKTWLSMDDEAVRPAHRAVDGQTVPIMGTFDVGGSKLHFPGEPVGPPEVWINCRCLLATTGGPEMANKTGSFAVTAEVDEAEVEITDEELEGSALIDDIGETPWHGVLVVEGKPTGDKRQFDPGALTYRDFPLPIKFQRASAEGHMGDVVVGTIDEIWAEEERDGLVEHRARGRFNNNVPEANEVIDGLVFGMFRGVSIEIDDAEFELDYKESEERGEDGDGFIELLFGEVELTRFTKARITSASIVPTPAFMEAYVALGPDFEDELRDPEAGADGEDLGEDDAGTELSALEDALSAGDLGLVAAAYGAFRDFPADKREESADKGHAMPDGSYPIENEEDLRNAIQAIGRAKDPEAVKRHIKKRARELGREDLVPEEWMSLAEQVASAPILDRTDPPVENLNPFYAPGTRDGPGWLTHPRATQRLRNYWVHGEGAAKIRWGVPGDFNRCRRQLAKYVNPAFLAGTCANLHQEALRVWPGRERGDKHSTAPAPAMILASAAPWSEREDARFFQNPQLSEVTPLTVTEDGAVYGHLAVWGTCHIGLGDDCIMPPSSMSNYAFFATGQVLTSEGFIDTGRITLGTGHASVLASRSDAMRHYDNTGQAVADIAMYEDGTGIAYAGRIREGATPAQVKALRASALSGDWRRATHGGWELIGVLAVNAGGYPTPRYGVVDGRQVSILASAGAVVPRRQPLDKPGLVASARIDGDELLAIGRVVADELEYRQERRQRLASVRDPELLEAASARRADRIAAAKKIEE